MKFESNRMIGFKDMTEKHFTGARQCSSKHYMHSTSMLKCALNGHYEFQTFIKNKKNQSSMTILTYIMGIATSYIPTKFEDNLIISFGKNEENLLS